MTHLTDDQLQRFSRHLLLPNMDEAAQLRIHHASVLVVGAGGLGCGAAPYLAAAGVGQITLVDGDQVELSNLHRQVLHTDTSLGQEKVASAAQRLKPLNPELNLDLVPEFFSESHVELIKRADVVLDCSDNLDTRNLLNRLCYQSSTPLVSGAAIRFEGQLITLDMQDGSACYQCFSHMIGGDQLSCSQAGVFSPVVGVVGALQAAEALKLLAGIGEPCHNKLCLVDILRMDFKQIGVRKRPECQVCGA
ncbi:MAG: molybdopterin-synthase adenylyltransferase MoeB [Candidatus Pelagadaptatus aseana]|uniref:HesA/MoeB/ThiF family protein n=1 Tax=Candidatus Pelagadaptatus aseana TaxID=3120508 RepID=UPI0039B2F12B